MRYVGAFLLLVLCLGCGAESEMQIIQGQAFGTTYNIQYYSGHQVDQVTNGIEDVVTQVNASISTYQPNSLISAINRGELDTEVDSIFVAVYEWSKRVHQTTKGYFDPTVGILRNAYGFGQDKPLESLSSGALDSLCIRVGFAQVDLLSNGRIVKPYPETYLDFNAIGKGYGIDLMGVYLESLGVTDYLIELGGEIRVKGFNVVKQKPWTIGIEAPSEDQNERIIAKTIALENQSMASSGNYRKFRVDEKTGKRFVHTINPLDCTAQQSNVTSATVLASTCAEADAYATAFMAMGLERSLQVLETQKQLSVYLTYIDQQQVTRWYASSSLAKRLGE